MSNVPAGRALKDQNRWALLGVLMANFALLSLVVKTGELHSGTVEQALHQWQNLLPAGLGTVFAGIINTVLSPTAKARIVAWRWHDPLPGSRAFSHLVATDPRIDAAVLRRKLGVAIPTEPNKQNALWYKTYLPLKNDPAVEHVHRQYLFSRDYSAIALMLFGTVPIAFFFISSWQTILIYIALLIFQYLMARQSAYNTGNRLITTVLALKAAGK